MTEAERNDYRMTLFEAMEPGRSPLLLTGRTEHLKPFATTSPALFRTSFVLKGGMGRKQRQAVAAALAVVPAKRAAGDPCDWKLHWRRIR